MLTWDEQQKYACYTRFNTSHVKEMGKNLKIAREKKQLTQEDVADIMSVSTRTIQRLESGEKSAFEHLTDFCQIYSCTFEDLMPRDFLKLLTGRYSTLSQIDTQMLKLIQNAAARELENRNDERVPN